MITVWFATGDLAASVRFNADVFKVNDNGRLLLHDASKDKLVAMFNVGTWIYVCEVESEVVNEA
jgi:hypothetical protein